MRRLRDRALGPVISRLDHLEREIETSRLLLGQQLARSMREQPVERLSDAEFKIFSQFGEDGILQHLVSRVPVARRFFVEFGVEDYRESNTRFLLYNDGWRGLVMDASADHVARIRRSREAWAFDLGIVQAFVTRENVNELLESNGAAGDIGLLSIDVDGNDYWIWQAVEVASPRIVVVEYNSVFGSTHAVTVPYDPRFHRTAAHSSNLYFGASLKALCLLARDKGYVFVGSNGAGVNAFFVRSDVAGAVDPVTPEEGFVDSQIREAKNVTGELSLAGGRERLRLIADMQVLDLERGELVALGSLQQREGGETVWR
jgi:hypothetical protein